MSQRYCEKKSTVETPQAQYDRYFALANVSEQTSLGYLIKDSEDNPIYLHIEPNTVQVISKTADDKEHQYTAKRFYFLSPIFGLQAVDFFTTDETGIDVSRYYDYSEKLIYNFSIHIDAPQMAYPIKISQDPESGLCIEVMSDLSLPIHGVPSNEFEEFVKKPARRG